MKLWHFSSLAVLALAGCSSPPPVQNFPPLDYSYLPPLVLKVSNLTVVNNYVPSAVDGGAAGAGPSAPDLRRCWRC